MQTWPQKDPDEVADFDLNWALDTGDSIATSVWVFNVQAGLVKGIDSFSASATKVWLSGGTDGAIGVLTNTITTASGRTFEDSVSIPIISTYPVAGPVFGYVAPTPSWLITLFPPFAAVPTATIQAFINQAMGSVDAGWIEADYPYGIVYLAAHLMVMSGLGTGAQAEAQSQGMGGFTTIRSGQLTLQRAATSRDAQEAPPPWNTSWYGVQYYWLLRRNKPPASVALSPPVGLPYPAPFGLPVGVWPNWPWVR